MDDQIVLNFCPVEAQNKLVDFKELIWTSTLTCLPKVGVIVKHNGSSSRTGWVGVIVKMYDDEGGIGILWLLDRYNKPLRPDTREREDQPVSEVGIYQKYTETWANARIISGRVKNYSIFDFISKLTTEEVNMVTENQALLKKDGLFLVWGEKGRTNPTNPTSYKEALKAAESMAQRHKEVFHVLRLDTKVEPVITVKTKVSHL